MNTDLISRADAEALFRTARSKLNPSDYKTADEFNTRDLMLLNAEQMIHLLPSVTPKQEPCDKSITWITGNDGAQIAVRNVTVDKMVRICAIIGEEPCDDAISRRDVLDYIYNDLGLGDEENGNDVERQMELERSYEYVKSLSPVNPQPKTGHWEWVQYDYNPKLGNWQCSECRCVVVECVSKEEEGGIPLYKYCPQCGAKIVKPQESEE